MKRLYANIKIFGYWFSMLAFVLIMIWLFNLGCPSAQVSSIEYQYDTVIVVMPPDTIMIREAPATRTIRHSTELVTYTDTVWKNDTIDRLDTVLIAQPFESILADTVLGGDTLSGRFAFPPPRFDFTLRQQPDSIRTIIQTITITQPSPWYDKVGWVGVGSALTLIGVGLYEVAK